MQTNQESAPRDVAQLSTVLNLVASGHASTRAELARATKLSVSTISQRTNALIDAHLLIDEGFSSSSGGRRASLLHLNPAAGLIATAVLGATQCQCAVLDLNGQILASSTVDADLHNGPREALPLVATELRELVDRLASSTPVVAVSLGIASVVDPQTAALVRPLMGHEWDSTSLATALAPAFPDVPVFTSNDADLMALGEHRARGVEEHSLIFIKVGTGIGGGIIDRGRLVSGTGGGAGDIGHVRVAGREDARCTCGKTGCLTAVASGRAISERLRSLGVDVSNSREIIDLLRSGDLEARHTVRAAAHDIGGVVATLVAFANPDVVVIGGLLGNLSDDLLTDIRSSVYGIAQPLATSALTIESSRLGEQAASVGAGVVALRQILSPGGLHRLLSSH